MDQGDDRSCGSCGEELGPFQLTCHRCLAPIGRTVDGPAEPPGDAGQEAAPVRRHALTFEGSAGEYFRIWIVNVLLTVVTLGVYTPWAKVRTRRYFYSNTFVDGCSFDYLANPVALFKGYVTVVVAVVAIQALGRWEPRLALVLGLLYAALFPYVVWRSVRFRAHNSSYRNLRFQFAGGIGDAYKSYLVLPVLVPLSLGILAPYWTFRQKRFLFGGLAFGNTRFRFGPRPGAFYRIYGVGALLALGFAVAGATVAGLVLVPFAKSGAFPAQAGAALGGIAYLGVLASLLPIAAYAFVRTTNLCWAETTLGPVAFESTLKFWPVAGLWATNAVATVLSLGLLAPWAKVRKARYLAENLTVLACSSLEEFAACEAGAEVGAFGEAAADFFDVEFGF